MKKVMKIFTLKKFFDLASRTPFLARGCASICFKMTRNSGKTLASSSKVEGLNQANAAGFFQF